MLVVFLIASIALVVLAGATEGSFLPLAKAECAKKLRPSAEDRSRRFHIIEILNLFDYKITSFPVKSSIFKSSTYLTKQKIFLVPEIKKLKK